MAADNTSSNAPNVENILSAVQNWVAAQNSLTKSLSAIISSNHVNLNLSNLNSFISAFSTTAGTVTTINTSVGLLGGPITVSGTLSVSLTKITASTTVDILLNNVSSYFDGPSVAQGSSGVWFASGTVTFTDTSATICNFKLWDGTTVIHSAVQSIPNANNIMCATLSGFITSPSGNIRISVNDTLHTTGTIKFNASGNSKDSTITAIRIG